MGEKSLLGASSHEEAAESQEHLVLFPKGTQSDYDNSSKLRRLNLEKYPSVKGCSQSLLEDMKLVPGFFPQRPTDVLKLQHHVAFFVVNLYYVFLQDQSRWLSFSRNKMKYTGKDSKYKHTFKLSHEYSVNKVVKFLLDNRYIEHSPFIRHADPSKSRQSRIRSTQKLIDLIRMHEQEPLPPEEPGDGDEYGEPEWDDYEGEETIVVKGLKPPAKKITWIQDGKKRTKTIHPKRKICKTPDTPHVRHLRECGFR